MGHVVITGASSGLGEALAIEMGRRGHTLGLVSRRLDMLGEVAEKVRATGAKAAIAAADCTDREAVHRAVASLVEVNGPVDLLVANAGGGGPTPATKIDAAKIVGQMRLNFEGVVYAFEAVLPAMVARKAGHVAAVSSLAAFKGMPGDGAYSASKAAVSVLCDAFGLELAAHGIAVTTIHPGFVRTPMTAKNKFPMPFMMDADRAARIMADGLERRKREINYPFPTMILARLARWIPARLLMAILNRARPPKA
jgi:short-subunit dehydrogenase